MTWRRSKGSASSSSHLRARGTSITFGLGLPTAAPGSIQGTLVVSDIEAAHDALMKRGSDVSDIWHGPPFPLAARQPGPDPERTSYGSFCSFNDPDGNLWIVQEVTSAAPGPGVDLPARRPNLRTPPGRRSCVGRGQHVLHTRTRLSGKPETERNNAFCHRRHRERRPRSRSTTRTTGAGTRSS